MLYAGDITKVHGIRVGQAENESARTGVTVILCKKDGAVGGCSVRGAAPGTRETDLLRPGNLVEKVHAVVLAGGSAFGLDAAGGVMRWLEQNGIGLDMGDAVIPIVPAAVLYDLSEGDSHIRPDAAMGRAACMAARKGMQQVRIPAPGSNTTLAVVATDARLTKEQANRLADVAHDGYARTIRPVHTQMDGDTVFALATGQMDRDINFLKLCAAAAEVTARAIVNAVLASR